jgi:deaminated glutathione amidase
MTPFAIAGIQMHISAVEDNTDGMLHRLDILMSRFPWVQMVVFSELAPHGPLIETAQPFPNDTERKFQEAAARHRVWLIPGSMFEQVEGGVYNTASVIDPQGRLVGRYRKMFPFAPYEQGVESGSDFMVFDVPGVGRFGLSICYDIWFPETTRTLTAMGVEVLLHPVLTGTIDRDVEISIARATAAMFQCYVVDVNGLSVGGFGKSCVFDPTGTAVHQAAGQEEMIAVEIDLDMVRRQREVGMKSLGQLHKSFRDRVVDFPVYDRATFDATYLNSLGPLQIPHQGSRAGLDVPPPGSFAPAPVAAPVPVAAPIAAPVESLVTAPIGALPDVAE